MLRAPKFVVPGLDPPAGPKPLRRGEGPGIHVFLTLLQQDVDGRVKPGHGEKSFSNMRFLHVNPPFPALTAARAATM
jgi:hypothetical protein